MSRRIEPNTLSLTCVFPPGEKSDIKLDVYVDKMSAYKLNSGEDKLYDILVLHLEGGKDIFITVTGDYDSYYPGCIIGTVTVTMTAITQGASLEQLQVTMTAITQGASLELLQVTMTAITQGASLEHYYPGCIIVTVTGDYDSYYPGCIIGTVTGDYDSYYPGCIIGTVTGTYERSCFGSSIEALVYISVPIRDIPVGRIVELENSKEISSSQEPYPIPKEIWFLVDHLYRHGLKQQHLFEQPGLHSELVAIRNWLDCGSPDPMPGGVHSVVEALLLLLESTAEPIIPYNLHNVCLAAGSNYLQCKQVVMQLPEHRKNVFLYLCAFLQETLGHVTENGLDAKTVATLFGTIFLRDPPRSRAELSSRSRNNQAVTRKKANFVYHFLVNDQSDLILGR
uniref:Rho-GAP domain-containing protein n=1 Tax=Timema monikensis TaxID=170555 RepID=A0A7R9HME9_9NEOP|nr:unnamed protein product [Timema monikensis]